MEPIPEKIRVLLEKQALRGAGDDLNPAAVRTLADKLLIGQTRPSWEYFNANDEEEHDDAPPPSSVTKKRPSTDEDARQKEARAGPDVRSPQGH